MSCRHFEVSKVSKVSSNSKSPEQKLPAGAWVPLTVVTVQALAKLTAEHRTAATIKIFIFTMIFSKVQLALKIGRSNMDILALSVVQRYQYDNAFDNSLLIKTLIWLQAILLKDELIKRAKQITSKMSPDLDPKQSVAFINLRYLELILYMWLLNFFTLQILRYFPPTLSEDCRYQKVFSIFITLTGTRTKPIAAVFASFH